MKVKYVGLDGYNNYGDDETKRVILNLGFEPDDNSNILMFGAGTLFPISHLLKPEIESGYFKKVMALGTGVENPEFPTKDFDTRMKWLREFIPDKSLIGLRCEKDKEVLGFGEVVGDPFFMLDVKALEKKSDKKNFVLVNIGQSRSRVWGEIDGELGSLKNLCKFIKHDLIEKQNENVMLFSVWGEDVPFLKLVSGYTGAKYFTGQPTIENIFNIVANAKYVISYKLHAMITALAINIPVIPIEYRPKIRDVARDFGVDKFCLRTDEVTIEALKEKVNLLKAWDYEFVNTKKLEYRKKFQDFTNKIFVECEE
jgi:hypothetical protein